MKGELQHTINAIKGVAAGSKAVPATHKAVDVGRPDNALSRSIRNQKDAAQFRSELKAAVAFEKMR
ncbi:hypothetical protein [Flavobacterium beibuense]|uniref:Uncharacterized protein n=1 Tax=Flavobacterium beibuense TaxID=657326 RepID=A0A444WER3_9FLAO|nr:hypothetical protein [Flavobacterium beibuense]RYJ44317.1 hypothetical protein NU09_0927 [Flavobacterium beibuense]